ncbi:MAG: histidine phosphatase family protein [Alphaproteobacteria bacterium]
MKITRWWWIRHAPVTSDGGCIYGQRDLAADVSDAEAFAALAGCLPRQAFWVTSHLKRTHQTAAAIADARAPAIGKSIEPAVEPDLAEQHFGEWQGRNRAEVYREHGHQHALWLAPAEVTPPGGESFVDLTRRVAGAIERLTAEHEGGDIIAVAHGGTIRAALGHALQTTAERALAFSTDNLSLTRIDHIRAPAAGAAWRVVGVNLSPHGLATGSA